MLNLPRTGRRLLRPAAGILAGFLLLELLIFLLQSVFAHRTPQFFPDWEAQDLSAVLEQDRLQPGDYDLIFTQTGLAPAAVDELRSYGSGGLDYIRQIQEAFFQPVPAECQELLPGRFTCEDILVDGEGRDVEAAPLAPMLPGDIMVSFSTHSVGWRHGHAGLVLAPLQQVTLEAVQLGMNTYAPYATHWSKYSNFMILRVRDADWETRVDTVRFAVEHLYDIPYSLLAGVFGPKEQRDPDRLTAQCAYLPWRAWLESGLDLDSDGGRIVTIADLAESRALEVVQVYGIDPHLLLDRQAH